VAAEQAATKEAETSRRVSDFMVSIFEVADPSETRGNTVTAREILDRGAARIKSDLQNEPDARATLLDAIGRVYQSLGLYASAETLLQEGLALRRQIYGEEHVKVAESLNNLAFLLQDRGRYEEARPLFEKALNNAPASGAPITRRPRPVSTTWPPSCSGWGTTAPPRNSSARCSNSTSEPWGRGIRTSPST
jgi:tetratricopeptide (TPR) repeat protein